MIKEALCMGWDWVGWMDGHPYLKFCGLRDLLLNYNCCFIPPLYVEAGFMCLPSSLVTIYFRGLT